MIILTFVRLWHPSRVLMFSFLTGGRSLRSDAPAIFCQRSALNQPPGNFDLFCIRKFHTAPVHSPLKWKQKLVALGLRPAARCAMTRLGPRTPRPRQVPDAFT